MKSIKNVVIFCGASNNPEYFSLAYLVGKTLAENGFVTITGGGSGMMRQVNKGAFKAGGESIGICINHPKEKPGKYLTKFELHHGFDKRHKALIQKGDAFVVLPGGLGTILEGVEITQKKKFKEIPMSSPLIFVGSYFNKLLGVFSWIKEEGFIREDLEDMYSHAKTPKEMIALLME